MRIALVADAQSPNTESLIEILRTAGHDLDLVSLHCAQCSLSQGRVHYLSESELLAKWKYPLKTLTARGLIRELDPDLVIGYRVTGNGLLAFASGVHPLVMIPTGTDVLLLERRSAALRMLVRFVLSRSDAVLCWAPHLAAAVISLVGESRVVRIGAVDTSGPSLIGPERLTELSRRADRRIALTVQPRGIDRLLFAPRNFPPESDQPPTFVCTRRLKRCYRHDLVIRSLARLRSTHPWRIVFCGEGPEETALRQLASELGVADRVRFMGHQPQREVARQLAAGSFYISLIDHDGVSASLLEAMSVGLYPILTRSAATDHWVRDGENGQVVESCSLDALVQVLAAVLSNPKAFREAVVRNQEVSAARADSKANGARIDAFLRSVRSSWQRRNNDHLNPAASS